jgi:two-component system, OmpR family, phosphate regulon sensor histidine kinase PhoR
MQKIRILAVLMSVALAGVIVIQFLYIKSALQIKEEQFDRTVNHALLSVSVDLENKYGLHLVTEKLEEDSTARKAIMKQDPGFYKFMVSVNQHKHVRKPVADSLDESNDEGGNKNMDVEQNADDEGGTRKTVHIEVNGTDGSIIKVMDITDGQKQEMIFSNVTTDRSVAAMPVVAAAAPVPPMAPPAPPVPPTQASMMKSALDTQSNKLMNIVKSAADEWAMSQMSQQDIVDVIDSQKINDAIRNEFAKHGLPLNYVFATYCVPGDTLMINKTASHNALKDFSYQSPLLANDFIKAGSLLLVDFPGHFSYLFASLGGLLLLSLFFTLSIIVAFAYSMHVILQQKKLSEVTNDFINNMTHELKTPLATISMTADTLGLNTVSTNPGMVSEYSGLVKNEVKKLSGHVDRILSAALIEKNGHEKTGELVCLNDLLADEVKVFEPVVQQQNGKIEMNLPAESVQVRANKDMLRSIIGNLLDNAVKYSHEKPVISITLKRVLGNLWMCVEDNGIGISKADQKMIFEKFYRASTGNRHDVKGFGLGLNFVQSALSQLNGKVWVESELGKGSRFYVEFPVQ